MTTHAVAVDIGGTTIRVALADRDGRIVHRRALPTHASQGKAAVMERVVEAVGTVVPLAEKASPVGVGVALGHVPSSGVRVRHPVDVV